MDSLNYNSVENLPGLEAKAVFKVNSSSVFKEDVDIVPTIVDDSLSYVPWGGDNQMPFNILELIEKDETLATYQIFNAEVCFGRASSVTEIFAMGLKCPWCFWRQSQQFLLYFLLYFFATRCYFCLPFATCRVFFLTLTRVCFGLK